MYIVIANEPHQDNIGPTRRKRGGSYDPILPTRGHNCQHSRLHNFYPRGSVLKRKLVVKPVQPEIYGINNTIYRDLVPNV